MNGSVPPLVHPRHMLTAEDLRDILNDVIDEKDRSKRDLEARTSQAAQLAYELVEQAVKRGFINELLVHPEEGIRAWVQATYKMRRGAEDESTWPRHQVSSSQDE